MQVLYQRYIRATQVLYQLPIKTSGENSCIAKNEAIRNFCGGYYRVDDINYLCHVRYGMFPHNKSLALGCTAPSGLVIYCGNIPNDRDVTNTYDMALVEDIIAIIIDIVRMATISNERVCYCDIVHVHVKMTTCTCISNGVLL